MQVILLLPYDPKIILEDIPKYTYQVNKACSVFLVILNPIFILLTLFYNRGQRVLPVSLIQGWEVLIMTENIRNVGYSRVSFLKK